LALESVIGPRLKELPDGLVNAVLARQPCAAQRAQDEMLLRAPIYGLVAIWHCAVHENSSKQENSAVELVAHCRERGVRIRVRGHPIRFDTMESSGSGRCRLRFHEDRRRRLARIGIPVGRPLHDRRPRNFVAPSAFPKVYELIFRRATNYEPGCALRPRDSINWVGRSRFEWASDCIHCTGYRSARNSTPRRSRRAPPPARRNLRPSRSRPRSPSSRPSPPART